MLIVFDIDGTLTKVGDRVECLQQTPKDWDSFYNRCGEDKPNEKVVELCQHLAMSNGIIFVTGRRESCREATLEWMLDNNIQCDTADLFMRPDGDWRHDTIVKPELVKTFIHLIELVFEDRDSMVAKWRELGITCCQVAEGKF